MDKDIVGMISLIEKMLNDPEYRIGIIYVSIGGEMILGYVIAEILGSGLSYGSGDHHDSALLAPSKGTYEPRNLSHAVLYQDHGMILLVQAGSFPHLLRQNHGQSALLHGQLILVLTGVTRDVGDLSRSHYDADVVLLDSIRSEDHVHRLIRNFGISCRHLETHLLAQIIQADVLSVLFVGGMRLKVIHYIE